MNIAHIGYRVVLGPYADTHRELLKRDDVRSYYLIERVLGRKIYREMNTYIFSSIPKRPLVDKIDKLITEKFISDIYERFLSGFYEYYLKKLKIDIIHAHFGMAGAKLERVKKRTALPLLTTFYGVDASQCLKSSYWAPRIKRLFDYGDCFIVLSDEVKKRFIQNGCDPKKIRVWNCLVDFSYPYTPRNYQGGAVKLITAARFVEKKGYPFLVRVMEQLVKNSVPVTLTAVGYGKDIDKIKALIRQLNLEDKIKIIDTTAISEFNSFYNNLLREHHIFVLASTISKEGDDEGGPALSLITAQAAGLPVVCTPFIGSERSVIDGETGLIGSEEIGDFSSKLAYLIEHDELWNVFGKKGSDFVRKRFSKDGQAEEIVKIYKEVLNESKGM